MRNESTTSIYVPAAFPALPDYFLTHALYQVDPGKRERQQFALHLGLNASDDAFYGETPDYIRKLQSYKLLNVEMGSSAIFKVAHLRGLKAAMVCSVSGSLVTVDAIYEGENEGLIREWGNGISVALEGIYRNHRGPSNVSKQSSSYS